MGYNRFILKYVILVIVLLWYDNAKSGAVFLFGQRHGLDGLLKTAKIIKNFTW